MATTRSLIVNADDFGQSPGVNRGIIMAHEQGIVTSASLMVRWPAAGEAADYARRHPGFGVGLHLDLGEWACRDSTWAPLYEVVPAGDAEAVAAEVARQLAAFRRLLGREPTHLDSHQHFHRDEPVRSLMTDLACRLGVPLRHCDPVVRYCGAFYGQGEDGTPLLESISPAALIRIFNALPPGVTELACHPGFADDLDTMYRSERAREVETLCDPRVRAALAAAGIQLCSFADRPWLGPAPQA